MSRTRFTQIEVPDASSDGGEEPTGYLIEIDGQPVAVVVGETYRFDAARGQHIERMWYLRHLDGQIATRWPDGGHVLGSNGGHYFRTRSDASRALEIALDEGHW